MSRAAFALITPCLLAAVVSAQAPDSAPADTTRPALPPGHQAYAQGLNQAARGVAQLRSGVDRVLRTRAGSDTARYRDAGQRLGGLCGAALGFLRRGRAQMSPTTYQDSLRLWSRALTAQVDSLIGYMPTCQRDGGRTPEPVANAVLARLRAYEGALGRYRAGVTAALQVATPPDSAGVSPR
jgi:X-X-X-Leu-X-X-Gly heptad repeat protein